MSRRLVAVLVWLVVGGLLLAALRGNWLSVWGMVRQPSMHPPFADLRTITGAMQSAQQGFDPMRENPMDPWRRPLNYPPVWLQAFGALGIDDRDLTTVGLSFAALSLASVSWLILTAASRAEAALLGLSAVSHSALFAVERGNSDLVVFALLVAALRARALATACVATAAAALLKLFPFAAFGALCCERRRGWPWWPLLAVAGTAVLLALQFEAIARIVRATPVDYIRAYGVPSLRLYFQSEKGLPIGAAGPWLVGAVCAGAVLAAVAGALRPPRAPWSVPVAPAAERMFVGGGLVYAGTFLLGSNYDYRLLFLLPALPWLWQAYAGQGRKWRDLAPVLLVLFVQYADALGRRGVLAGHAAKVLVAWLVLYRSAQIGRRWLRPAPAPDLA
jgi:hypothetical protein